ncbi:MAG: vitamin K epoxide reductase family protein [Terracidiphilus sp.]
MMRFAIVILSVAGALVAALALQVHYSTATEPCSINEKWDCGVVNHSPFAVVGHVPVAAIGIAGYLALAVLAVTRQRLVLHVAALIALIFSLRLSFIEEFDLQLWCLYCVISQGIIGLISLLSLGWLAAEYISLKRGANRAG